MHDLARHGLKRPSLRGLHSEVKLLAAHVLASEAKAAVIAFFWKHPDIGLKMGDVAFRLGHTPAEVARVLEDLVVLGFVQKQLFGGLAFYSLTGDKWRLARLDEFVAWQESWLQRAQRATGSDCSDDERWAA